MSRWYVVCTPSSVIVSQLLSTPSQISVAQGLMAALRKTVVEGHRFKFEVVLIRAFRFKSCKTDKQEAGKQAIFVRGHAHK
ncbi:MAG: hypothetical protein SH848_05925 [Saprospiraceae bacterium]|nr:hypothetical protein [Saprospiraceae bacterium]MDZ4703445.1 hypothetical protein [Saprospiraceae bacterium]